MQKTVDLGKITQRNVPIKPKDENYWGKRYQRHVVDDFFIAQLTPSNELPKPQIFLNNLARCTIEILSGVRNLNQISGWVDEQVYSLVAKRVVIAERARRAKNLAVSHPNFEIGRIICCEPSDGIVEATVLVHGRGRTRAIAIRIEGIDSRWRATALHVL